jgi:hypothetical protein
MMDIKIEASDITDADSSLDLGEAEEVLQYGGDDLVSELEDYCQERISEWLDENGWTADMFKARDAAHGLSSAERDKMEEMI